MEHDAKIGRGTELLLGTLAALPALYWMLTDTGPFRLLSALERQRLGWSSDKLTLAVLALPLYGVLRAVVLSARPARIVHPDDDSAEAPEAARGEPASRSAAIGAAVALALLGLAGWVGWQARAVGPLRRLDPSWFASAAASSGPGVLYAEVEGVPVGATLRERKPLGARLYAPLGGGPSAPPFALVVEVDEGRPEEELLRGAKPVKLRGLARRGSLDPAVAHALAEASAAAAEGCWVLRPAESPRTQLRTAWFLAGLAPLVGLLVFGLRRRSAA